MEDKIYLKAKKWVYSLYHDQDFFRNKSLPIEARLDFDAEDGDAQMHSLVAFICFFTEIKSIAISDEDFEFCNQIEKMYKKLNALLEITNFFDVLILDEEENPKDFFLQMKKEIEEELLTNKL